jgi:hypothetical protein
MSCVCRKKPLSIDVTRHCGVSRVHREPNKPQSSVAGQSTGARADRADREVLTLADHSPAETWQTRAWLGLFAVPSKNDTTLSSPLHCPKAHSRGRRLSQNPAGNNHARLSLRQLNLFFLGGVATRIEHLGTQLHVPTSPAHPSTVQQQPWPASSNSKSTARYARGRRECATPLIFLG